MGGRLPPHLATVSATVPSWVVAEFDRLAAELGSPSRSKYLEAITLAALAEDKARHPAAPAIDPTPGPEPTPEGDGP